MSNTILIKKSATPAAVPSTANVALGELAINTHDGRLFTKIDTGTPSIFELTQNQPITATGNVTGVSVNGTGNTSIALTLSNTGVSAGTYGGTSGPTSNIGVFTVDEYGRITSASNAQISTSSLANGNANIQIYANGDISINPGGTANVAVFSTTGQSVTGLLSVTGNATAANLNTSGSVSATGNVTAGNVNAAGLSLSGNVLSVLNSTSNITTTANIEASWFVGNAALSTASVTGNTTSGNLLTGGIVSATGNVTAGNVSTAGNVAANGVLTDNYYYANGAPVDFQQAAGSNTQLQFNNNNDFGASANLTFDSATNLLTVTGTTSVTGNITGGNILSTGQISTSANVTANNIIVSGSGGNISGANVISSETVSASANVVAGNVTTGGLISATGNITGNYFIGNGSQLTGVTASSVDAGNLTGNTLSSNVLFSSLTSVGTLTSLSVSGNTDSGNLFTSGVVSATGNAIAGNLVTGGLATVTGNVVAGNVTTSGEVSATGNVTGGNFSTAGLVTATGNVTGGNLFTGGIMSATGNVTGGNVQTSGAISATGNATVGNVSTGIVTASGNVTGANVNTAGVISATGNVTGGNVNTGAVSASGNVDAANYFTGGLISAAGNVTGANLIATVAVVTGNVNSTGTMSVTTGSGDLTLNPAGNINVNNNVINNLGAPQLATDAVTKQYVDDAVSAGIHIHTPVYVETPVALPTSTYAQGGNTYTVTDTIAGNTVVFSTAANLQVNDQLWFSNSFNGVVGNLAYFVVSAPNTSAAVLSTAYNGVPVSNITNASGLTQGVRVNSGIGATLTATANGALTIDGVSVSSTQRVLVYQQASAAENGIYVVTDAGNISAPWILTRATDADQYIPDSNDGLDQGSYFFVQAGSTGAGESYVLTNPTGPFIIGYANVEFTQFGASGVYTANTAAGLSLNGTQFNAKVDNDTTAFDGGGNIVVKASANLVTPNIGNATGSSLSVTGNITGGNVNFDGGVVSGTGNVIAGNLQISGLISTTGNITVGNVSTGVVSASGNVTGGNFNTTGSLSAGGNITAGNLQLGDTANVSNLIVRTLANITSTQISTSNTTGALKVAGGVGVTGNIYADGMYVFGDSVLTVNSTIDGGTY